MTAPTSRSIRRVPVLAFALAAALSAQQSVQQPDDALPMSLERLAAVEPGWPVVASKPAWAPIPPRRTDVLGFTTHARAGTSSMAMRGARKDAAHDVRDVLFEHLEPALGVARTVALLEDMMPRVRLVEVAVVERLPVETEDGADDFVAAAFLRWELPVRAVVAELPPKDQGRLESLLVRDVVPWQRVADRPAWVTSPPRRAGYVRAAFDYSARYPKLAREGVVAGARERFAAWLIQELMPAVGPEHAARAVDRAMGRFGAVARAWRPRRDDDVVFDETGVKPRDPRHPRAGAVAYVLWEVPTTPLLEALPEELRSAAREVLLR